MQVIIQKKWMGIEIYTVGRKPKKYSAKWTKKKCASESERK